LLVLMLLLLLLMRLGKAVRRGAAAMMMRESECVRVAGERGRRRVRARREMLLLALEIGRRRLHAVRRWVGRRPLLHRVRSALHGSGLAVRRWIDRRTIKKGQRLKQLGRE
jgi:hypothetical protein